MSQGAFGDIAVTSLPKMAIGEMATLVEDDVLRATEIRDGKLVMCPVTKTYDEVERGAAVAAFLRRLERHKKAIASLFESERR